jgi:NAD(P)-dependent dehydrogenase (short-subunit alcohol dehydrogenase family)
MTTAIITGASRGLGKALATGLAEHGWSLVLDARGAEDLSLVAKELSELTTVTALPGDVTDDAHRRDLVAAAIRLGGLDLLVNNAGALGPSPLPPLASYPPGALADVLDANVVAPVALTQLALPLLRASRRGAVLNVTSDAAVEPYAGWGGYGASKAALEQASAVLAAEEPALRVWWVDPGDMRTRMHQDAFPGEDISDRPLPEESVPGLIALIDTHAPSGRYRARGEPPAAAGSPDGDALPPAGGPATGRK